MKDIMEPLIIESKTLFMTDLRIIQNSRRGGPSFLGVFGRFLKETLDDDRLVKTLAPEYFKHWSPESNRHSGSTARMILKDFKNKLLIVVTAVSMETNLAEMVLFQDPASQFDINLLHDLRELASNRWSKGKLTTRISQMNKVSPGLIEALKMVGWKQGSAPDFLEIELMKK